MKDPRPIFERRPCRLLAVVELVVVFFFALGIANMLRQAWISTFLLGVPTTCAATSAYWSGWNGNSSPWKFGGSDASGGFWLDQTRDVLASMQETFWNGTYYGAPLQWTNALINAIVVSTERTFTNALDEYDGNVPGARPSAAEIQNDIRKYYSQIEAFYTGEDTIQIFNAAYDDAQWVVLEWLEAIKFIQQYDAYSGTTYGQEDLASFAHRAHIFYNIVQDKFNTSTCEGGVTWNPTLAVYKNAITNELFVSSSIAMYLYYPGDNNSDPYPHPDYTTLTNQTLPPLPTLKPHDPLLLQNAIKAWSWFQLHNFTNAQGLIVDGFHVSDNQTTCDERNEMVYTYNQGLFLSGLRGLWEATGDSSYLSDGYSFIDVVINATGWNAASYSQAGQWAGLGRNGIMEDYCDAPANCSNDALIFKGAYFEHLDLFCEPLPTETPLVQGLTFLASQDLAGVHAEKCEEYAPWVRHNAYAALSTRNATSNIIGEWWGASYVNRTQAPAPAFTHPRPYDSVDIWNKPWLLEQPPWRCDGRFGCLSYSPYKKSRSPRWLKRQAAEQARTVSTQAQGLAVVKAAADFSLKRKAFSEYVRGGS